MLKPELKVISVNPFEDKPTIPPDALLDIHELEALSQVSTCPSLGEGTVTSERLFNVMFDSRLARSTDANVRFPDPSVFIIWPLVPSVVGKTNVVLLDTLTLLIDFVVLSTMLTNLSYWSFQFLWKFAGFSSSLFVLFTVILIKCASDAFKGFNSDLCVLGSAVCFAITKNLYVPQVSIEFRVTW